MPDPLQRIRPERVVGVVTRLEPVTPLLAVKVSLPHVPEMLTVQDANGALASRPATTTLMLPLLLRTWPPTVTANVGSLYAGEAALTVMVPMFLSAQHDAPQQAWRKPQVIRVALNELPPLTVVPAGHCDAAAAKFGAREKPSIAGALSAAAAAAPPRAAFIAWRRSILEEVIAF